MFQCYLTIIVLMSYLSYLVPQYSLCTIVRYMKCILLVLTNHRHYFSIISSYTIHIMCSFYYYTSYCIVTVHTFLSPLAFLVFNSTPWFSKPHIDINYWAYPHKLVHVAISTVYYLYLNTKAHKYVHCLIEYSLFILIKRYIIESYENSMFMSLFSPYLYSYTQMCTPPLISQDIHRFCLVYTTTCTFSTYYMNMVRITLI